MCVGIVCVGCVGIVCVGEERIHVLEGGPYAHACPYASMHVSMFEYPSRTSGTRPLTHAFTHWPHSTLQVLSAAQHSVGPSHGTET